MDVKYLEPLVRRAVQEKFPESLHTMFEIMKRASMLGNVIPSMNGIPGIGENLNDAIRKLIFDNFYTVKGAVSELAYCTHMPLAFIFEIFVEQIVLTDGNFL